LTLFAAYNAKPSRKRRPDDLDPWIVERILQGLFEKLFEKILAFRPPSQPKPAGGAPPEGFPHQRKSAKVKSSG
jgi:hypothetical protein